MPLPDRRGHCRYIRFRHDELVDDPEVAAVRTLAVSFHRAGRRSTSLLTPTDVASFDEFALVERRAGPDLVAQAGR